MTVGKSNETLYTFDFDIGTRDGASQLGTSTSNAILALFLKINKHLMLIIEHQFNLIA